MGGVPARQQGVQVGCFVTHACQGGRRGEQLIYPLNVGLLTCFFDCRECLLAGLVGDGGGLGLDLSVLLAVKPELGQDGAVSGALEQGAKDELQRATRRLVVRHLVEVTEEPHHDERDSKASRVSTLAVQPKLGHSQEGLHKETKKKRDITQSTKRKNHLTNSFFNLPQCRLIECQG